MKKSTIVRTILLFIVVINMILKATGHDLINVDESQIYDLIEMLISVGVIVLSWWKNNSFTSNALKADKYLEDLKRMEQEERE